MKKSLCTMILMSVLFSQAVQGAPLSGAQGGPDYLDRKEGLALEAARPSAGRSEPTIMPPGSAGYFDSGVSTGGWSPKKEAGMSFLLPGLGQYRMGHTLRAKIYFGLEAAGWIATGAFYYQSIVRKDEYMEYAVAYGGVNGTGHPEDYYEKVGNYISNEGPGGYNEYVLIEARNLYYPDTEAMNAYFDENMISGEMSWRWETGSAQRNFRELFAGSDESRRRAVYALFFIAGLRVVSSVDALRLARDANEKAGYDTGIRLDLQPQPGGFRMSLCRSF